MGIFKKNKPALAIASTFFAFMTLRTLIIFKQGVEGIISVIPDDAFYYLTIAKHAAQNGKWTFDGLEPTTGFHFLFAELLRLTFTLNLNASLNFIFVASSILSSILLSISVYLISKLMYDKFKLEKLILSLIPFLTISFIIQSTLVMESSFAIFFSAITFYLIFRSESHFFKRNSFFIAIGFFGVLSRSDYIFLPVCIVISFVILRKANNSNILPALFTLAGSVIGEIFLIINYYHISGRVTQGSAAIKLHWSSVQGLDFRTPAGSIIESFHPWFHFYGKTAKLIFFTFLLIFFLVKKEKIKNYISKSFDVNLILASGLTLICYSIFYGFNSAGFQVWYIANLIVPSAIFFAILSATILRNRMLVLTYFILVTITTNPLSAIQFKPYPHQVDMYRVAKQINLDYLGKVGAWNAGIYGYFNHGKVVNLDGLVNDGVTKYILDNNLEKYLALRKIEYLVDYRNMFVDKLYRQRGGYDTLAFVKCVRPDKELRRTSTWSNSGIWRYRVSELKCAGGV